MGRISHREYRTWHKWLQDQWNVPARSDYLLMRIAQRIQQVLNKKARKVTLEQQDVDFTFDKKPTKVITPEEATKQSKRRWFGLLGMKG